jgi:hypothetical protein
MKRTLLAGATALALAVAGCIPQITPADVEARVKAERQDVANYFADSMARQAAIKERLERDLAEAREALEHKVEKVEEKVEHKVEELREWKLEEHLDALARWHLEATGETLDWRGSVVDLLKAVGFESSVKARREFAGIFDAHRRYRCTAHDNAWLHAEVIKFLKGE